MKSKTLFPINKITLNVEWEGGKRTYNLKTVTTKSREFHKIFELLFHNVWTV